MPGMIKVRQNQEKRQRKMVRVMLMSCVCCLAGMGCKSTVNTFDYSSLCSPLLAAGAGVASYKMLEDESDALKYGVSFGAAAGTYAVSEAVRYKVFSDYEKQVDKGYALGRIDGWQRQHNILRNMKMNDENSVYKANVRYLLLPGVEEANGVHYIPHQVKVKIVE